MAKAFLAAFHIVFVTFVFVVVCTCIVENKIIFSSSMAIATATDINI